MTFNNIEKYNSFDDIYPGDIVVFEGGAEKVVSKINDGHKAVFEDGDILDLWIFENQIKGIIHINREEAKPKIKNEVQDFKGDGSFSSNLDYKKSSFISLANNYKELYKKMYHGGDYVEFYHITAAQNAINIFKGEFFYSRESAGDNVTYDNIQFNEITSSVMSSNCSYRIEKYARFYLNIKNRATYSMHKNYLKNNTFPVIIAVNFTAIWTSKTHVILSPSNGHNLDDDGFNWKMYDISKEVNLKNIDNSKFDFYKTYEDCSFTEDNKYNYAEILFYDKIALDNVSHIYFKNFIDKKAFLSTFSIEKRKIIEGKCLVDEKLFW